MTNRVLSIETGHTLGLLGLFLMLVIARLANHAATERRGSTDQFPGATNHRRDCRDWVGGRPPAVSGGAA
jgi:hypothetical protein